MHSISSQSRSRTMSASSSPDIHSSEYLDLLKRYNPRIDPADDIPSIVIAGGSSEKLLAMLEDARHLRWDDRSDLILNSVSFHWKYCSWTTPLLKAIRSNLPDNVSLLLEYGANPNGISMADQEKYCRRFRRMRRAGLNPSRIPSSILAEDVGSAETQLFPLMDHEINARKDTISRFWLLSDTLPLELIADGYRLHSLVAAANSSAETPIDTSIFTELLEAGADASFWKGYQTKEDLHGAFLSPSSLSVTTPLHSALKDVKMLRNVLYQGLNPNARALIVGCQALTPMQEAIRAQELEAFHVLAEHPLADKNIKTPVLDIHLHHLAIAQLDLELLEDVHIGSLRGETTALGHNLAHVACMARDVKDIQLFSPKIRRSIHDIRSLDTHWHGLQLYEAAKRTEVFANAPAPSCDGPGDPKYGSEDDLFLGLPLHGRQRGYALPSMVSYGQPNTSYYVDQTAIVKQIVACCGFDVLKQKDYCGNTPLHYLASMRIVNEELISWLRKKDTDSKIWTTTKNEWHFTPADLWIENVSCTEPCEDGNYYLPHSNSWVPGHSFSGRGRGRGRGRGGYLLKP